jgi:glycerol-3-phosphate dehydrogenase
VAFSSSGPHFYSQIIQQRLNVDTVAVLMGANVASDVARGDFVESTLACQNLQALQMLKHICCAPTFRLQLYADISTVELYGALKNVVALGAGVLYL